MILGHSQFGLFFNYVKNNLLPIQVVHNHGKTASGYNTAVYNDTLYKSLMETGFGALQGQAL